MDLLSLLAGRQPGAGVALADPSRLAQSALDRRSQERAATSAPSAATDQYQPTEPNQADTGYRFERQARLDYSMTLQFDLSSFSRTVAQIANGDVQAFQQYASAGFGLSADLAFEGYQTIREFATPNANQARSMSRNSQASLSGRTSQIDWQSRGLQIRSFLSEASQIRRSFSQQVQKNHRFATNRLAARYQIDTSMNLQYLTSFNRLTERMASSSPESLPGYLNTAGRAAQSAPTSFLGGFFETTESYLDAAEQNLTSKASAYFEMAAEELGFEGELVDMAREHLAGSVTRFFDRIDAAVDKLESYYSLQSDPGAFVASRFASPAQARTGSYLATA